MMEFKKLRIKAKLTMVVLLTCTIGLVCAGLGIQAVDKIEQKEIIAEEMSVLLKIIAARSAAALSFQDQTQAKDNLNSLFVRDSVELACMYDANNRIFQTVTRGSEPAESCPEQPHYSGGYSMDHHLEVYQNIQLNGVKIGTVMVRANYSDLDRRLQSQILLNGSVLCLSLILAFSLTYRLQRTLYQPIINLGEVASKIIQHNNFLFRASTSNEDEIGETVTAFNIMLDKIKQDKEELTRLAFYDSVTKLANRRMFGERLLFAIENARRSGEHMGLLFLDLDKFKDVNDELGHEVGDLVLKATADRMEKALPANATVFRLGADEFAILQVGVSESELELTAQRMLRAVCKPLSLAGRQVNPTLSIGLTVSDGNQSANSIVKNTDIALSQAKAAGGSIFKTFR